MIKDAEFWDMIDKIAALNVSGLERHMFGNVPYYLSDREERVARKSFAKSKEKSVALRHPVLTGIPTLGIWPGVAKGRAYRAAATDVEKHYPVAGRRARRSRMINASKRREEIIRELNRDY